MQPVNSITSGQETIERLKLCLDLFVRGGMRDPRTRERLIETLGESVNLLESIAGRDGFVQVRLQLLKLSQTTVSDLEINHLLAHQQCIALEQMGRTKELAEVKIHRLFHACHKLGYLREALDILAEAEDFYGKPFKASHHYDMATLAEEIGDFSRAIKLLEEAYHASREASQSVDILYRKAEILLQAGQPEEAVKALRGCLILIDMTTPSRAGTLVAKQGANKGANQGKASPDAGARKSDPPLLFRILAKLGEASRAMGDLAGAWENYCNAMELLHTATGGEVPEWLQDEWLEIYDRREAILERLPDVPGDPGEVTRYVDQAHQLRLRQAARRGTHLRLVA